MCPDPGPPYEDSGEGGRRHLHAVPSAAAEMDEQYNHVLWGMAAEGSPVSMCLVGLDGTLWMPNQAFAEMIGYSQAELRGMTFQELTYADDLQEDLELLEETLSGQRTSYRLVKRYCHANGGVVWADLSVALMRSQDGEPLHFIALMLDVTAQRLDLERLAQAVEIAERERNLSQAILDTVDVGLVLVDRDGSYERVNRRQHEILAMAYPEGDHGDGGQSGYLYAADGVTRLLDEEMPAARAVRGEEFDDDRVWVGTDPATRRALSVSARAVRNAAGQCVGAALAFSDVTDLVQALRAREVFESSVSHELRTPLTTVLGYLEVLLEEGDLSEPATRQMRTVQRNATRLRYLVSDLLDPAARGQGAVTLSPSIADVSELVQEAGESLMPAAREGGVVLSIDARQSVRAVMDADRMRQVVENLISNAIKYTDTGGQVGVELEIVGDEVAITVTDTGIGIAADDVEQLFDPFFRAGRARERMSPGLGLGLGIAQSIVVAHGGQIGITSVLGEGSAFRVVVPLDVRHE